MVTFTTPTNEPEETWLTTEQAARRLGVEKQTLANWRCEGKGPAYRKNGANNSRVLYRLDWIEKFERQHTFLAEGDAA